MTNAAIPFAAGLAGVATSVGPCVAPRFVAVVAIAQSGSRRARYERVSAFACGVAAGYAVLTSAMSMLTRLTAWTSAIDGLLAAVFVIAAIRSATSSARHRCRDESTASAGRAFVTGMSLSLVGSPCCAPVLLGLAALSGSTITPAAVAIAAGCFALGHVIPLVAVGSVAAEAVRAFAAPSWANARATVACGLFLGLGAFYAWQA